MAALVGPYFVDWTSYRQIFERQATDYIGRPVTVAGKAQIRILPTPVLSFTDVRIGEQGAPLVEIERIRAEVELAALLQGDINVIDMVVERPLFRVDLAALTDPSGTAQPGGAAFDPDRIALAHTEIIEGTMLVSDPGAGRQWQATGINAIIEAGSLLGPGRVEAGFVLEGRRLTVRAGLGRFGEDGRLPLKLSVSPADYPVGISTDGTVTVMPGEPPKYEGTFALSGVPPAEGEPSSPLGAAVAEGAFGLTAAALDLSEVKLSYGPPERPLAMEGTARLDLGADPKFSLALAARQIDLDRSLGGGDQPIGIETAVEGLVAAIQKLPVSRIPGSVRFDAQGVVAGGNVIQAVGADFTALADGWRIDILSALLPGETRLDLTGDILLEGAPAFTGHVKLNSSRPAAFSAWWRGEAGRAARLDEFSLAADLALTAGRQGITNLRVASGGDSVTGDVDLRRFMQSNRSIASVRLRAGRLDVERGRALFDLFAGEALAGGRIEQITLDLQADVLAAGGVEAQDILVAGIVDEGGTLKVDRFFVGNVAGASIGADGEIHDLFERTTGQVQASINAEDLQGAASFLEGLFPDSPTVAHFKRIAPALTPLNADVTFTAAETGETLSLSVDGAFADTRLALEASGRGSLNDAAGLTGSATASVRAPESAALLRQLGFGALALDKSAPASLTAAFEGSLGSSGSMKFEGSLAGIQLSYTGMTTGRDGQLGAAGKLEMASEDIDPALLLAGMTLPEIGVGHAVSAAGDVRAGPEGLELDLTRATFQGEPVRGSVTAMWRDGLQLGGELQLTRASLPGMLGFAAGIEPGYGEEGWVDEPFVYALPDRLAIDVRLTAEELAIGLPLAVRNAAFALQAGHGVIEVDMAEGDLAGGGLSGTLSARFGEQGLNVGLRASLDGANLEEVAWTDEGRAVATGRLSTTFDVTSQARSMAGLISTLAGSGSFALADASLRSVNPLAFDAVIRAADAGLPLERESVGAAFSSHLDAGRLDIGDVSGSFDVSSGVLRVPTVSVQAGTTKVLAGATLDLNNLLLKSDWSINTAPVADQVNGSEPQVGLVFEGPLRSPERRLDVMPLLGFLNIRAIEREVDRVEQLQAEIAEQERQAQELRARQEEAERLRLGSEADPAAAKASTAAGENSGPGAPAAGEAGGAPGREGRPLDLLAPTQLPPGALRGNSASQAIFPGRNQPPTQALPR